MQIILQKVDCGWFLQKKRGIATVCNPSLNKFSYVMVVFGTD